MEENDGDVDLPHVEAKLKEPGHAAQFYGWSDRSTSSLPLSPSLGIPDDRT